MAMEQSHIWVGVFGPNSPKDYFDEVYDEEDEDAPISKFAGDQGERWIDHDWVEMSFLNDPIDILELAGKHSYSNDYDVLVSKTCKDMNLDKANVFIIIDKGEVKSPKSLKKGDFELHYLGVFNCDV
jgi:hypothetical protein